MYEILIRVESLFLESPTVVVLGCGILIFVLGLLLWLGGSYFSAVILGLLGAVVGSACGLLVSQWLNTPALISMLMGAVVFTFAAVLFRNALIILLSILVFSLAGVTGYSSLILHETPPKSAFPLDTSFIQPFSQMDASTRLAYLDRIGEKEKTFFERLRLLIRDSFQTMNPYKWKILLIAFLGGIAGLVLIWTLKKLILAVCYSGVGALLVLMGLEIALLGIRIHLISWFQSRPSAVSITYLVLVVVGTIYQLITVRSSTNKTGVQEKRPRPN